MTKNKAHVVPAVEYPTQEEKIVTPSVFVTPVGMVRTWIDDINALIASDGRGDQFVIDSLREAVHQLNHAAEALAARQTS